MRTHPDRPLISEISEITPLINPLTPTGASPHKLIGNVPTRIVGYTSKWDVHSKSPAAHLRNNYH